MILVGEVEFNERHFHVDGLQSFLFVGTQLGQNAAAVEYVYALSPVPTHYHVGDIYKTRENLSVTEFLQRIVNTDVEIGRGVIQKWDKAKARLKGMTEWIERNVPPVENHRVVS